MPYLIRVARSEQNKGGMGSKGTASGARVVRSSSNMARWISSENEAAERTGKGPIFRIVSSTTSVRSQRPKQPNANCSRRSDGSDTNGSRNGESSSATRTTG